MVKQLYSTRLKKKNKNKKVDDHCHNNPGKVANTKLHQIQIKEQKHKALGLIHEVAAK